jgi:hypothetical protein
MVVIAVARIPPNSVDDFVTYERVVFALLPDHGGTLAVGGEGLVRWEADDVEFGRAVGGAEAPLDPRRPNMPPPATFDIYELEEAPVSDLL